ncbi:cation-translocating P-type ATPase [Persicimonas caeni]|uniref:cation-translocating P-type ATPase n=1 Tax=Persicimonas caeni TaxID=2292766 RepID=UPI001C9BB795|nr:cation-transporting P-type ATPase [Persicimonas caeni]
MQLPKQPWSQSSDDVLENLDVVAERGLSSKEAMRRHDAFGANVLETARPKSVWRVLYNQFESLVVLLLLGAAVAAFAFGEYVEGVAIGVVIFINTAIGFFMELRAVRSMEALRTMAQTSSRVRRDAEAGMLPARELVPGDIVELQAGDVVSADMRLVGSQNLQVDESVLTGESVPVEKQDAPIAADAVLGDRTNMLFKGTAITRGQAQAVVTATGMATELGRITELVQHAQKHETPLEERIDTLARKLVWVCLVLAGLIALIGFLQQRPTLQVIGTAIALAVATIPEGLPIVATIALARGMFRMARRNALVRNLAAVETLGSTSIVLTDKTGTLTENRMTVDGYVTPAGAPRATFAQGAATFAQDSTPVDIEQNPPLKAALEIGMLCNGAEHATEGDPDSPLVGDPVEIGLLQVATAAGFNREELRRAYPETREESFDATVKMMGTFHKVDGRYRVAVKGAPEAVLRSCTQVMTPGGQVEALSDDGRADWLVRADDLAQRGLRVLALAEKWVDDDAVAPYEGLVFVGLVAFIDPPRDDVRDAIAECHGAGIRVVMVTGDHPATALHIAQQLQMADETSEAVTGAELRRWDKTATASPARLVDAPVFARVSPEQKLDLVELHKRQGAVVAMTGDGVNDAPALTRADIGIAMGQRGTQVAREASDMVLQDDAFSTIVHAVEQGRIIFDNIRKFVVYLLSCNISELFVIAVASLFFADLPLPITPLQILFLNLVTDVFPALALGLGEGERGILSRPPRDPAESVLTREHWLRIFGWGSVITLVVLGVYASALYQLDLGPEMAVTMSFLTLALAQLWHVFNMRGAGSSRLKNDITKNRWVWGAIALCIVLTLAAVYIPPLAEVLDVVPPTLEQWAIVVGASLVPAVLGVIRK